MRFYFYLLLIFLFFSCQEVQRKPSAVAFESCAQVLQELGNFGLDRWELQQFMREYRVEIMRNNYYDSLSTKLNYYEWWQKRGGDSFNVFDNVSRKKRFLELDGILGRGSEADVYLVRDLDSGELLAVREYRSQGEKLERQLLDFQARVAFYQERGVRVPKIHFVDQNRVYYEYVEGLTYEELKNLTRKISNDHILYRALGEDWKTISDRYRIFDEHASSLFEDHYEAWFKNRYPEKEMVKLPDVIAWNVVLDDSGQFVLIDP